MRVLVTVHCESASECGARVGCAARVLVAGPTCERAGLTFIGLC